MNNRLIVKGVLGNIFTKTDGQVDLIDSIEDNDIVFAIGAAGTGKTFTAVAAACKYLAEKQVNKIVLVRPAVEAGENLGFLPGSMKEKLMPFLIPLYDSLGAIFEKPVLESLVEKGVIEIAPLAYMRGRTLNKAFIILDEAQNATELQMKMLLTRLGQDSKLVITGDPTQIDLPPKVKSGLESAVNLLNKIKGIGVVKLTVADVLRHKLVKKIIEAYESERTKTNQ